MKARRCCHFQGSPHTCVWEGFCPSRRECWVIVFQGLWKSGEPSKAPQVGVFTDMVIRSWETCPRFQILHLLHSDHRLLCMPRHHGKLLAPKWNTPYCYLLCRTSQVSCRLAGRKVLGWWCRQGVGRRPGLSGVSITHTWTQASFTFCPMTAMCDITACLWEALIGTWRAFKRMMLSVALCVSVMDFEFILKVAERRIRAALNQTEPGKGLFLNWGGKRCLCLSDDGIAKTEHSCLMISTGENSSRTKCVCLCLLFVFGGVHFFPNLSNCELSLTCCWTNCVLLWKSWWLQIW